jgi:hypothetical protein
MPGRTSSTMRPRPRATGKQAPASTSDISKFARVTKLSENRKQLQTKAAGPAPRPTTSIEILLPLSSSRKRKADNAANLAPAVVLSKKPRPDAASNEKELVPKKNKPNSAAAVDTTGDSVIRITERAVSKRKRQPDEEPLREPSVACDATQAGALLERLNLQSSPARKRSKPSAARTTQADQNTLPSELIDLLGLHRAFLKTLGLHYAHGGTNVPVDLRAICPDIAQAWGKRKVTVEDIRRCIGIVSWNSENLETVQTPAPLSLCDYGRGKICLELHQGSCGGLLNDRDLNATFEKNLRAMWSAREDANIQWFMSSLPKAVIRSNLSATHISPILAKGQQRLEEIKDAMAKKQQEKDAKAQSASATDLATSKMSMSLLDRIRQKEAQAAQAPQGPTAAELQREAALQRAEDVADVLRMLVLATSSGQPRISFTMPVVLLKLKDSLRVPMSSEEGAACIRLLAAEVAPRWLRVVTIGGKENIVIQVAFQPTKDSVQRTVMALSKR